MAKRIQGKKKLKVSSDGVATTALALDREVMPRSTVSVPEIIDWGNSTRMGDSLSGVRDVGASPGMSALVEALRSSQSQRLDLSQHIVKMQRRLEKFESELMRERENRREIEVSAAPLIEARIELENQLRLTQAALEDHQAMLLAVFRSRRWRALSWFNRRKTGDKP